jgi:hypothetical protein
VLAAFGACGLGAVVALADNQGEAEYNSGLFMTVIGGALVIGVSGWWALALESKPARRITPGDVVAVAGGLLIIIGVNRTGDVLKWIASVPSSLAGALAVAAPTIAVLARRSERWAALVATIAGAFAIGAAGMAEAPGRPMIILGGLAAAVGGALAFRARSQL